jgi:hypothetical protein
METWVGIAKGLYKISGAVVREAADNPEMVKNVVNHIITVSSNNDVVHPSVPIRPFNVYDWLSDSSQSSSKGFNPTNDVLRVSKTSGILSGLNLVVSALGFAFLSRKLKRIEDQLNGIAQDVRAIRDFLERRERAELRVALRELANIEEITDPDHRHPMLHNARRTFILLQESYQELLAGAKTPEEAMGVEEYLCLVSLCQSRCLAEMEQMDVAGRELNEAYRFWQEHVRRIAKTWLIDGKGRRLISLNPDDRVPITVLLEWFDFVEGRPKGFAWLDNLREEDREKKVQYTIRRKKQVINVNIPFMEKVVARNNLFEGYVAQYDLMAAQNMSLKQFIGTIEDLRKKMNLKADDFVILSREKQ